MVYWFRVETAQYQSHILLTDIANSYSSLYGLAYVGLGSLGNGVEDQRWWQPLIGFFTVLLFAILPYSKYDGARGGFLNVICLALSMGVVWLHVVNFLTICTKRQFRKRHPTLNRLIFWPSSLIERKQLKQAAKKKLCSMTTNALEIHRDYKKGVVGNHFGKGLDNFALKSKEREEVGGFQWTWKSIFDGSIYFEHGVWYSNRLVSSNFAQAIISIYVLIFGIRLTKNAVANYDSEGAKSVVYDISQYIVSTSISEEVINDLLSNFTFFLGSYAGGVETEEFLNCSDIAQETGFGSKVESFCTFVESVGINGTSDIEKQLSLLANAGFDVEGVRVAAATALAAAAETPVESLYPTEAYM